MTDSPVVRLDARGRELIDRHTAWWQRKASLLTFVQGAPLGDLWLPLSDGTLAHEDMAVTPDVLDLDRLAGPSLSPGTLQTHGDLFRVADPYGRVPWVEAVLGTPIHATIRGGSMRTSAFVRTWNEWNCIPTHWDAAWADALTHLTDLLVQRSGGQYTVVQPTMRGPADLAEAVLGPVLMCLSMYDDPESLGRFLDDSTTVFLRMLDILLAHIPRFAGGYVSPFGIWAPGTVVRTQCDATAFLSAAQYRQWFLPRDLRICQAVDYSFIHLHSCSLHIVDALLAQPLPSAIQITLESEPKGPSLQQLLPAFRAVLQVKPLLIEGKLDADQVAWLRANLPAGGLAITARQNEW